jgi:hypothetical protein
MQKNAQSCQSGKAKGKSAKAQKRKSGKAPIKHNV